MMQTESLSLRSREQWLAVLAKAKLQVLADCWQSLGLEPAFRWLRSPESGTVMVKGRMGGEGGAFNLGEMLVTRCSLQLESGPTGHAWIAGRSHTHALQAALCDALMQTAHAERVMCHVLLPLLERHKDQRRSICEKAEATRVDFLTLVRGED